MFRQIAYLYYISIPMKQLYKHTILLIVLCCSVFAAQKVDAQEWSWGRGGISDITVDAWCVATDRVGNIYEAGLFYGLGNVVFGSDTVGPSTSFSGQAVWAKYNSVGAVLWAGGTISGSTYLYNITTDPAGNLIVFGAFNSATMQIGSFTLINAYTDGTSQYYLAKISPTGTVLWAINDGSTIEDYSAAVFGFTSSVFVYSSGGVTTDTAGNIYITSCFSTHTMSIGTYTLTNTSISDTNDIYIAKYNASGSPMWATSIGGTGNDNGFGITATGTGKIYITGEFNSPSVIVGSSTINDPYYASEPFAYIAEFSATTGSPLWAQAAGGPHGAFSVGVACDVSGNVYMTGGFGDTSINFGSATINQTYPVSSGKVALYLVEYSPYNTVTWSKTIGSSTKDVYGYSIALTCGQVWVSGNYKESVNIDGDTLSLVSGPDPVFIAGYNLSGGVTGYSALGSGGDDQNGIATDDSGNIYFCSDYLSAVVGGLGIIIGPDTLPTANYEFIYLGKYATGCNLSVIIPPITGDTILCKGDTTTLTDTTTGGTWSSSNTSVAIVSSSTGFVTGISVGTAIITYSVGTGYVTKIFSVVPPPSAITGVQWVCVDSTTSLSDSTLGGVWSSSNTAAATVGSSTGIVTGLSGFSATITYSISVGCFVTTEVYINSLCNDAVLTITGNTNQISIFPTPASTQLTIQSTNQPINQITITNLLGKTLLLQNAPANCKLLQVNISTLPPAVYFVKINGTEFRKFVKE